MRLCKLKGSVDKLGGAIRDWPALQVLKRIIVHH